MAIEKRLKIGIRKAALGFFFVLLGIFGGMMAPVGMMGVEEVSAVPNNTETEQNTGDGGEQNQEEEQTGGNGEESAEKKAASAQQSCQNSLGAIGWLVCPVTGKLAEAVDWLYERLEGILVINPVEAEDGQPIYEIWKIFLGFTNIVFVIFLVVVIYSQITGMGITNYGIKRALPKLIVMAIMVNLSFLICSIAVDVSNILGMGVRQIFQSVEETVAQTSGMSMHLGFESVIGALGGAGLAVGATVVAFETGAIWMLIPTVLAAIVSVVVGLITIAMRQAVVTLLVMISPIAMVCMILPNTEQWFNKWRQLFFQMLVFYPMFSLLFGASALAGFAIMASATDGFGLILGVAVQTLPLFFAWKLMQMSGTFLSTVNAKLSALATRPLGRVQSFAERQRDLTKQKNLAGQARTPSMRLMQFMSNRRIADEAEISEHQQTVKNRGLAYRAMRNYRTDGTPSRRGERTYQEMTDNLHYQRAVLRDKNNMDRGLESLVPEVTEPAAATAAGRKQAARRARMGQLDTAMITASDYLKAEQARGEKIEYENAVGHQERMTKMMNAHLDEVYGFTRTQDANGNEVLRPVEGYRFHANVRLADQARYRAINQIMDGSVEDTQVAAANAAVAYDTQRKIMTTKMNKYFDLTVPTKEIELKMNELTKANSAVKNIDTIVAGLRVLNQRGDLDLVLQQTKNVLDHGVELGTHASQELGNFLMFEVKDRDPFLRRFGKYINLETAMIYSANKRNKMTVDFDEMVLGKYEETDPETGQIVVKTPKMGLAKLMLGTPLEGMERKAMDNLETLLKDANTDENGRLNVEDYLAQRKAVEKSIAPAFISAALKFPSGSDQIKTMVSFLTGYDDKGKARWAEDGDLAANAEAAEAYFRGQTVDYIRNQTPSQILGLRSDFYDPLMQHFARAYELDEMEEWSDEERERHAGMVAEMAEIQTRYEDLPAEEQAERRAADMKKLRERMAATKFRGELDKMGKLDQIYRTRRSGAANNAKDWVRDWLGLDDEVAILAKLKNSQSQEQNEDEEGSAGDASGGGEEQEFGGFDAQDREMFGAQVQVIYNDWVSNGGGDAEEFYEESREFVENTLHGVGGLILSQYDNYRELRPNATAQELLLKLQELLYDSDNY